MPVLVELFRRVEEGTVSLDERRCLPRDTSRQFASGHLRWLRDEPGMSLRDYARLMIGVSDDMATDVLMELVGLDNVNVTMDELGFQKTRVTMNMGRWHYTMVDMAVRDGDHTSAVARQGDRQSSGIGGNDRTTQGRHRQDENTEVHQHRR